MSKDMAKVNVLNLLKVNLTWILLIVEATRNTPIVMCINCGAEGHRMRDCPDERKDLSHNPDLTCRSCKSIPSHLI